MTEEAARLLLVDSDCKRAANIAARLRDFGFTKCSISSAANGILRSVEVHKPEVIVLALRDTEDQVSLMRFVTVLNDIKPMPIIMFAQGKDKQVMAGALAKGVTMFVTEEIDAVRIADRVEIVLAQFERMFDLQRRLASAEEKLSEQKIISRAKALLIEKEGLGEDEAHKVLRQYSMSENLPLVDVSVRVIDIYVSQPAARMPRSS